MIALVVIFWIYRSWRLILPGVFYPMLKFMGLICFKDCSTHHITFLMSNYEKIYWLFLMLYILFILYFICIFIIKKYRGRVAVLSLFDMFWLWQPRLLPMRRTVFYSHLALVNERQLNICGHIINTYDKHLRLLNNKKHRRLPKTNRDKRRIILHLYWMGCRKQWVLFLFF